VSRPNPQLYVVDASTALKWYLQDEHNVAEALRVFDDFGRGSVRLIAPDHVRYEIGNALWNAVRRERVTTESARQSFQGFLALRVDTVGQSELLINAFDYAHRFGCALYDALYLALADMAQCPLVHADRRLRNTLGGRFGRELWIEDYPTASSI
jgi:predicted nucleic acid-binding protein